MELQTISNKYIDKDDLIKFLTELFGSNFAVKRKRLHSYDTETSYRRGNEVGDALISGNQARTSMATRPIQSQPVELKMEIERLRRENIDGRTYIPYGLLTNIVTFESVVAELKVTKIQSFQPRLHEIANRVLSTAIRVFALLVLSDAVKHVQALMERHFLDDNRLPFDREVSELMDLTPEKTGLFYGLQQQLLAPQFNHSTVLSRLKLERILPFREEAKLSEGAFGFLYKVALDKDNQNPQDPFPTQFVRKELKENESLSLSELENLAILNRLKHPNVVELLSSYSYKGAVSLIFPLAEEGDLKDFLDKERRGTQLQNNETLIRALAQFASGLQAVHDFVDTELDLNFIGCHHDLKPQNILISGNKLLLADFGLSSFRSASQDSKETAPKIAGDYYCPEWEQYHLQGTQARFPRGKIGRSSDVWSFGCILAELLVYMVFGPKGVQDFREDREFVVTPCTLYTFHCYSKPNEAVEIWMSKVKAKDKRLSTVLVPLVLEMLQLNPDNRPKARDVTASLQLAAVFQKSASILEDLQSMDSAQHSLDASIQQWRLQAWLYGLGVDSESSSMSAKASLQSPRDFDIALAAIENIRAFVKSILEKQNHHFICPRLMENHINQLMSLLSERQQDRASLRLSFAVLESKFSRYIGQKSQDPIVVAGIGLDPVIMTLAALRNMNDILSNHSIAVQSDQLIDFSLVRVIEPFHEHDFGLYQEPGAKLKILIEWREYARKVQGDIKKHEDLFDRMRRLVALLQVAKPDAFLSLQCRGFFHDAARTRFGIVYDLPSYTEISGEKVLVTLEELIKRDRKKTAVETHPLLDRKFELAHAIVRAVKGFHQAGWLHRDLNSRNIVFERSNDLISTAIRHPHIIGLRHSRPDDRFSFTDGTPDSGIEHFQHPTYRTVGYGFKQEYDYYSVGIILLEIGLWKSVTDWTTKWKVEPEQVRMNLLTSVVPLLGITMGALYEEAVQACLSVELPVDKESPSSNFSPLVGLTDFQLLVEEKVVLRFQKP